MTLFRAAIHAIVAILALSASALTAPSASAQNASDAAVVQTATLAELGQALTDLGLTYDESPIFPGYLRARTADNLVFHVGVTACNDSDANCLGVHMLGYWFFNQSRRPEAIDRVMEFGLRYDFAKTFVAHLNPEQQDVAFIARYVITDYGISRGNLRENISVFTQFLPLFSEAMTGMGD